MSKPTMARSAKTGRIVSTAEAAANPDTTVRETKAKSAKKKAFKILKKLGAVADLLYTTRQERLTLNKDVEEMKSQETQLKNYIIDNLPKSDQTGASGSIANVKVDRDEVFQAENWDEVYAWIKKNNAFEILNRALNQTALRDRYENGGPKFKGIPGIIKQGIVKVSVTKVRSK